MAISVNWETRVVSVPQADLTLVNGTLYKLDTNWLRLQLKALEASVAGMPHPVITSHFTEYTIAGTTYARAIAFINGYSIEFEDGQYSVILEGSNNNYFDVQDGILVQNQVQVIPTNSAGLVRVNVPTGNAITEQDKLDIADRVWDETSGDHLTAGTTGEKVAQSGITPPTAEEIADQVWNEDLTTHTAVDSTGKKLLDIDDSVIPSKEEVADQVWDENILGHTSNNSAGKKLNDTMESADFDISNLPTVAEIPDLVWNVSEASHTTVGTFGAKVGGLPDETLTAQDKLDIADQVWDESLSAHQIVGSTGRKLFDIDDTAIPSIPTPAQIAAFVWDEDISAHVGVNSAGKKLSDIDATTIPTVLEITDGVWQTSIAGHSVVAGSTAEHLDGLNNSLEAGDMTTIIEGVWDQPVAWHTDAGSTGKKLSDIDDTAIITPPTVQEIVDGVMEDDITARNTTNSFGWWQKQLLTIKKFVGLSE